jgi:diguanylate cyclase (GGDEF)-like protein
MGMGSIGTAAFTKQRVIVKDVTTHPYWKKNRELAQQAGIGSSWAEPIIGAQGNILGAFGIYHHQPQSPTDYDITLIEQSARLISIAIERSESSSKIDYLAYYDEVTSLPNRRFLLEQLKRSMAINVQTKMHTALLYLDVDQFKVINDSRGHDVGDLLLIEVSNRLKRVMRPVDIVARIGGDEFVVLLENLSEHLIDAAKQAEVAADKILRSLSKPYTLAKHKHHSSVSIGITLIGKQKTDVEEILKQSDIAMYQAKKSGRNTFCFFDHKMQANITTLVGLENELRQAIKNKQLHLYYQVQVDHLGQPFGAEALIRWIHPERGMVSPAQFIPLAEESGLIIPIGDWVLDTACAQIKAWQADVSTRDLTLSVNISAKQFRQADFVAQVQACIVRHGIDPMSLRLELTESMLLENVEETVDYMNALGKVGVQFSLDDFGTGYSSLQYLKRLPLYQLKIDQSFVRDIVIDSHDRTIVRTIIAMAQSMYIGVIAEGVETAEQQELLLTNGCRRYQGYLFGKPVPIETFNQALNTHQT